MKTSLDIPEDILRRVMQSTGAKTKKDAVCTALEFYMQVQDMRQLAQKLKGSCETIISNDQLQKLREE